MARRLVGCALLVFGLACASASRTIQVRSVYQVDRTEVVQLGPGHFGGPWTNHSIDFWDPGGRDEMTLICTESGVTELQYSGPYTVSSCTLRSTKECRHPEGTVAYEIAATCEPGPDGLLVFRGGATLVRATGRFQAWERSTTRFKAWQAVPGPHDYGWSRSEMTVDQSSPKARRGVTRE